MATVQSPTTELWWLARSLEGLALVTFVALFVFTDDGVTPWVLITNLVTFYALLLRAIAVPDRILPWLPSYLSIEVLFLAFSYLIFYHSYQLFLLGTTELNVSRFVPNAFVDGSNKAITLTTIGMLAFTIGYRVLGPASRDDEDDADPLTSGGDEHKSTQAQYFHAMAIASSVLLLALVGVYLLAGWRSAGEGRYTGTTREGVGIGGISIAILMFAMIVAALWVYAKATGLRTPPLLAMGLAIALAWNLRLLILGDRNSFLLFALVLVCGYFTFVRRASLVVLAAAFAIWMFVYNIIEVLRFVPNWYRSGNIWQLVQTSPYYDETSNESSFNIATIAVRATVEAVPNTHDFMYGALKFIQFSTIIPFSGSVYLPYLNPEYTSSALLLGDILLPAQATYEPGTNVISDSYIDFGAPGVVVLLFAIGLFAKAIRNYVARDPSDAHRVVMYLVAMALLAELPRYAIELPARTLAWALLFSVLIGVAAGRFSFKSPAATARRRPSRTSGTTQQYEATAPTNVRTRS
jgi:hypothetical protein